MAEVSFIFVVDYTDICDAYQINIYIPEVGVLDLHGLNLIRKKGGGDDFKFPSALGS